MPKENYATIDTKGFEIELSYKDKIGKDFTYNINANFGYATNKLITKDEAENLRPYKSELGYNTDRSMGYHPHTGRPRRTARRIYHLWEKTGTGNAQLQRYQRCKLGRTGWKD